MPTASRIDVHLVCPSPDWHRIWDGARPLCLVPTLLALARNHPGMPLTSPTSPLRLGGPVSHAHGSFTGSGIVHREHRLVAAGGRASLVAIFCTLDWP